MISSDLHNTLLGDKMQHGRVTSLNSFWCCLKLMLKMRLKSPIYDFFLVCSLSLIFSGIGNKNYVTHINPSNATMSWMYFPPIPSRDHILILNDTKLNHEIAKIVFPENTVRFRNGSIYTTMIDTHVYQHSFAIKSNDNISNFDIVTAASYADTPQLVIDRISLHDKMNKSTYAGTFAKPGGVRVNAFKWDVWVFVSIYFFHLIACFHLLTKWMHSKALLILNTSGVKDTTIWTCFIVLDLAYAFISTFLYAFFLSLRPVMHQMKTDMLYLWIFFFFAAVAIYFSGLFIIPIFNTPNKFPIFALYYAIEVIGTWGVCMIPNFDYYKLGFFLPSVTVQNFFDNVGYNMLTKHPMNIGHFGLHVHFTYPFLIITLLYQIVVFFIIFFVFILIIPKEWGLPLIGITNIFSKRAWKRLFRVSSEISSTNCETFINVSNLTKTYKSYKTVTAINDLNFDVKKGEVILIIGPNGSGKTSLLSSLTGAIPVDSGTLEILGKAADFLDLQTSTGFCFQENVFFPGLNVRDHLLFFANLRGVPKESINDHIDFVSQSLGIENILKQKPENLSGGQMRCISVAMAYIGSPQLVILDEPTPGVDVSRRQLLWKSASIFTNSTTLITSHSMEEGENVASRIFVLKAGSIIFSGTASDLRAHHNCGYRLKIILKDDTEAEEVVSKVLDFVKQVIPEAVRDFEVGDCLILPVCDKIPTLLALLDEQIQNFDATGYTIHEEALESVMLRMIAENDENA